MTAASLDFTIFTDGGSSRGGVAAGACVIDLQQSARRHGAVVFLGEATNNEAEITAALLAFSFVRLAIAKRDSNSSASVHWVADSEYTLKSAQEYIHNWQRNGWKTAAKEPVKNQGLWRAYLTLSKGLRISTEHVRGHTGHAENEMCDLAANWAKASAEDSLEYDQRKVEIPDSGLPYWLLVDGRDFLNHLRAGGEDEEVYSLLELELKLAAAAKREEGDEGAATPPPKVADLAPALKELTNLKKRLDKEGKRSPRHAELAVELGSLIGRFSKSSCSDR